MTPSSKQKITLTVDRDVLAILDKVGGDNRSGFVNNLLRAILLPERDWRKFEVIHARMGHDQLGDEGVEDLTRFHTIKHIFYEAVRERFDD
jgi:hypothetical protein